MVLPFLIEVVYNLFCQFTYTVRSDSENNPDYENE